MDRRRLLTAATGIATALAGCSGGDSSTPTDATEPDADTPTTTPSKPRPSAGRPSVGGDEPPVSLRDWDGAHRLAAALESATYTNVLPDDYEIASPLHAGDILDDPLGEWYLYASSYGDEDGGCRLFVADSLMGEYTDHGEVFGPAPGSRNVTGPEVVYCPDEGELRVYYRENGDKLPAYSYIVYRADTILSDGTDFGDVVGPLDGLEPEMAGAWDGRSISYPSIVRSDGTWFLTTQCHAADSGTAVTIGAGTSEDGNDWARQSMPFAWNSFFEGSPQVRTVDAAQLYQFGEQRFVAIPIRDTQKTDEGMYVIPWERRRELLEREDLPWVDGRRVAHGPLYHDGETSYTVGRTIFELDWGDG